LRFATGVRFSKNSDVFDLLAEIVAGAGVPRVTNLDLSRLRARQKAGNRTGSKGR